MDELNPQTLKDEEHLKLLVIFQRIYGVLAIVFSSLFIIHIYFISAFFNNPGVFSSFPGSENIKLPPPGLREIFIVMIIVMIIIGCLIGVANLLSARFIKNRKLRIFSIVVAAINCALFPFGTILGVFTLIVLLRDSVKAFYEPVSLNKTA